MLHNRSGACLPDFSANDIIDWRLKRTRYAQPVVFRDYSSSMPGMDTPEPGIKLAGMAQIYPEDRGINYAVRLGNEAADSIVDYIRGSASSDQPRSNDLAASIRQNRRKEFDNAQSMAAASNRCYSGSLLLLGMTRRFF
jgi:hypothetical protein